MRSLTNRQFEASFDYSTRLPPMNPACLVVTLALFCIAVIGSAAEPPTSITLEGTLLVGDFYGPPDYGEKPSQDHSDHSLFLQLPAPPVTQLGDSKSLDSFGPEAQRTYFVQLVIDGPDRSEVEKAIGHKVEVAGVPFAPLTGHHRTPLLIDVKLLKLLDAWHL
ncbi:DUF4431 domain-containing protein [Paraburkholderia sacchari]|uniref:DUF4431 domain-containing protein n=1 Tax=Paraburkholderia sacchari TaxID=159450 RepID=UPI0039A4E001